MGYWGIGRYCMDARMHEGNSLTASSSFTPQPKALRASKYLIKLRSVVFIFLLVACGLWQELNYYACGYPITNQ